VVLTFQRSLLPPSSRKKMEIVGFSEMMVHKLWKSKKYDDGTDLTTACMYLQYKITNTCEASKIINHVLEKYVYSLE
jgi:hypothetical protein